MTIPVAVYTELILLIMSSKPARNTKRLIVVINKYKIVHLVGSYYTDIVVIIIIHIYAGYLWKMLVFMYAVRISIIIEIKANL